MGARQWHHIERRLTLPSRGRAKGRFAPFGPPLMSNVRPQVSRIERTVQAVTACRMVVALVGAAFVLGVSSCGTSYAVADGHESIGSATMLSDGSIGLHLRAEHGSTVGDALIQVRPDDPRYAEILAHIGGLAPGEEKPVPPWPVSK